MAGQASERPGLGSEISFFLCASGAAPFEFLCAAPFALQTHHRAQQQETMNSTTRAGRPGGGGERRRMGILAKHH